MLVNEHAHASTVGRSDSGSCPYDIAMGDLRGLNEKEGGYEPTPVIVYLPSGNPVEAWTYATTSPRRRCRLRPYAWYLDIVCRGAEHFDLPSEYTTQRLRARRGKRDFDQDRVACATHYLAESAR